MRLRKALYAEDRGGPDRRVRRPAHRRPGQCRRFQTHDRGPRFQRALAALQGQVDNLVEKGNQQAGLAGVFSMFRADTPQLYVDVDRTKCKTHGRAAERSVQHPASLPGRILRQRFQPVRPHLAGELAGRRPFPPAARRRRANSRSATPRASMVPLGALASVRDSSGAVDDQSLQHLPGRRHQRGLAPGHQFRPGHADDDRPSPRRNCQPPMVHRMDRVDVTRSSWRATRRCSSSRCASCWCSSLTPPNTKAGRCRWPSSSSCP